MLWICHLSSSLILPISVAIRRNYIIKRFDLSNMRISESRNVGRLLVEVLESLTTDTYVIVIRFLRSGIFWLWGYHYSLRGDLFRNMEIAYRTPASWKPLSLMKTRTSEALTLVRTRGGRATLDATPPPRSFYAIFEKEIIHSVMLKLSVDYHYLIITCMLGQISSFWHSSLIFPIFSKIAKFV